MEVLVNGMMSDVCDLAKDRAIEAAMKAKVKALRDTIDKWSTMEPSVPNDDVLGSTFDHYGSGAQNNNTGSGHQFSWSYVHAA
ncbi:hypothetical protein QQS21_007365 [Conoideocrella luteorostrata]|uniref:Uncharacterized protein n=1 Tax=Conoideocrella luteorostrata TaxID=1105319 RepID=A0AAJ0CLN9_9HYPO|nr:hypothetical protein QQS21_007365 [Conoideocrella luteorostrata]